MFEDKKNESFLMPNYNRASINFEKGRGSWLITKKGEAYLDFATGIAVNIFGHSDKLLTDALCSQAKKLWHVSNLYEIPEQELLAKRLCGYANLDKVFFCNSGLEANEAAVKIARRYHYSKKQLNKNIILCVDNAFHGRSLAMLAATDNNEYRKGFGPIPEGFKHLKFNDIEDLEENVNEDVAAIMIEPVQGEGGVMASSQEYMQMLAKIAKKFDCLVIMDEVQCGMYRTGKIFAYKHYNIQPDLVVLAKGLGGGFPIGAVISSEKIGAQMVPGTHGSTFGGNPLAVAVSNAVIDGLEREGFIDLLRENIKFLDKMLDKLKVEFENLISEIRGKGFLRGLKLKKELSASILVTKLREEKILTVPAAGNVIRILPPLNVKKDEITFLKNKISICLKQLS